MNEQNLKSNLSVAAVMKVAIGAFQANEEAHSSNDRLLKELAADEIQRTSTAQDDFARQTSDASQLLKSIQNQEQTAEEFLKQASVWYLDAQVDLLPIGDIRIDTESLSALIQVEQQARAAFERLAELTDYDYGPLVSIDDKPLGISKGVVNFGPRNGYQAKTIQLRNNVDYPITIDRRIGPYWAYMDFGQSSEPEKFILQPSETADVDILVGLMFPRQARLRFTLLGDSQIEIRAIATKLRFYLGLGIALVLVLYHVVQVLNWIGIVASPDLSHLLFGNVFMSFLGVAFSAALVLAWFAVTSGLSRLLLAVKDRVDGINVRLLPIEPLANSTHWVRRGVSTMLERQYIRSALESAWLNTFLLIPSALILFLCVGLPFWLLLSIVLWMINTIVAGLGAVLFTLVYVTGLGVLVLRWLDLYGYTLPELWTQVQQDINNLP